MHFSAQQIAAVLGGTLLGNPEATVSDVAPIEAAHAGQLAFVTESKYAPLLATTTASIVLVSKGLEAASPATLIVVDNARAAMGRLMEAVSEAIHPVKHGIEQPCFIAPGVAIPDDAYVGAFAYIAAGAVIGRGAQIYPQAYIGENVKIGEGTTLYAGAKVYYNCVIGAHCILHAGCVIGADGFGFETDAEGVNHKLPQIGNVVIEDDVEVGANTTIDRAMMGSTIVRHNAKVDNLVMVAHNCQVGESTFLCGQVGLAGSTTIGAHNILTGQVGAAGHLTTADRCVFGAQSGIMHSVSKPGTYMGSPAIDAMAWKRQQVKIRQL